MSEYRRSQLEKNIKEAYELLSELEKQLLFSSDVKEKRRLTKEIEETLKHVTNWEAELNLISISTESAINIIPDIEIEKVKFYVEFEMQHAMPDGKFMLIESIHLLLGIFDANVSFKQRRDLIQYLELEELRDYIFKTSKTSDEAVTTEGYEAIFTEAGVIAQKEKNTKITIFHLLQAFNSIRPKSVTNYFNLKGKTWDKFEQLSVFTIRRGSVSSL